MHINPFTFYPKLSVTWMGAINNYFDLISSYNQIYIKSYYDVLKDVSGKPNSLYELMIKKIDKELDIKLRSDDFVFLLSKFVNSFMDLRSIFKSHGYPVEYFDKIFDNYIQNTMILSSIPKEFDLTPFDVVHTSGRTHLLHYKQEELNIKDKKETREWKFSQSQTSSINGSSNISTPVLIIYAPINRFHIMDLTSKKSVIREFLAKGLDVYLLDWGYPSRDDDNLSIENYIRFIDDAIIKIKEISKTDKISILGYCWGGIIATIYSAINKDNIKKLALMAVPIDLSKDKSILTAWAKSMDLRIIDEFGHMDGQILDLAFIMRNPPKYAFDKYLNFFQKINDKEFIDTFIAVEKWLYDTPSIPGKIYSQIITDCYKNNLLIANKMTIGNSVINLYNIDMPLLTITAKNDDLVSPESTLAISKYISSKDIQSLQISGGHVGLCISTIAHTALWPKVTKWFLLNDNVAK